MEWGVSDCGKYSIRSLSAETTQGALKVIEDAFFPDETVCIGTEVNLNPAAGNELLELCADAALDGVSLVAVEITTGKIVAATFNKLQVASTNTDEKTFFDEFVEERCKQASSKALINFMSDFDRRCNFFERYGVDCSLELMFLATLREHRQKKLGLLLSKYSIDLGRKLKGGPVSHITLSDLGPKYAYMKPRDVTTKVPKICQAIATSVGTQRIGSALNFTVVLRLPFSTYVYEGKNYSERNGAELFCEGIAMTLD